MVTAAAFFGWLHQLGADGQRGWVFTLCRVAGAQPVVAVATATVVTCTGIVWWYWRWQKTLPHSKSTPPKEQSAPPETRRMPGQFQPEPQPQPQPQPQPEPEPQPQPQPEPEPQPEPQAEAEREPQPQPQSQLATPVFTVCGAGAVASRHKHEAIMMRDATDHISGGAALCAAEHVMTHGRHAARFTIGKRSGHMRVGVACVPRQNPQETLTSLSLDGWLWDAFSGALHHGGKIQQHNLRNFVPTTWDTGDTIDLQLDCELGTLNCYKDGVHVGLLATGVKVSRRTTAEAAAGLCWIVNMWRKGDTVRISQPAPPRSTSPTEETLAVQPALEAGSGPTLIGIGKLPTPVKKQVAAVAQNDQVKPEWRVGVANLCKKYPDMDPDVIARELANWGGHAGKAAHALQLKQAKMTAAQPQQPTPEEHKKHSRGLHLTHLFKSSKK